MKLSFRCPRCNHGVTLNVLDPQRQSPPTCGCRPGKRGVVMTRVPQTSVRSDTLDLDIREPGDACNAPGSGQHLTGGADMGQGTRSAAKRKVRA